MLYVIGLDETAVVVGDVFFVDPDPEPGQQGAESGVRVEVRRLEPSALPGSIYSARPIGLQGPLARIDLFETFPEGRGSKDRVHYHPSCQEWEPGVRRFDPELSADPLGWLAKQLSAGGGLLGLADRVGRDAEALSQRADEVVGAVDRIWSAVRSGRLDPPAGWTSVTSARIGWL